MCDNSGFVSLIQPLNITAKFCPNYFCSNSTPFYHQPKTYSIQKHIDLQRYCIQCNVTREEKFEEVLKVEQCPHFDRTICSNTSCTNASSCIMFDWKGGLCYRWDQRIYYRYDNFSHNVLYWIFFRYLNYLDIPLYVVLLLIYNVLVVLPEFVYLATKLSSSYALYQKVIHFLGLRTQSILWINSALLLILLTSIFDAIEFAN